MNRLSGIFNLWSGGGERRGEERRPAPELMLDSPAAEVDLVDVSESGLGVSASHRLRIGVTYPFTLSRGARSSEVYALVRWCAPTEAGGFRAGLTVGKTVGPALVSAAS